MHFDRTGKIVADEFVSVEFHRDDSAPILDPTRDEWIGRLTLSVRFYCPRRGGHHEEERKLALNHLAHGLYADALRTNDLLRMAINEGNRGAALTLCDQMERDCLDIEKLLRR